jgi:large subunit ribosomal protein L25
METLSLTATKRTVKGKTVAKLRKDGKLPAVLYGNNQASADIEINGREFAKVFKQAGESTLINLSLEGKSQPVIVQEVQNHYLTDKPIHVDFYAVNMTQIMKATIPLHFVGESMAVKASAGILVKNLSEVEVECLPGDLPHEIEVDISSLNTFEDAIHVSDLKVSDKVKILASPEEVVANVTPPRSEEELKSLAETPVAEDVSKVEGVLKPEQPGEENKEAEAAE